MNTQTLRRLAGGFGLGIVGFAAAMSLPNTFTSGAPISSGAVNDNFAAVGTAVDAKQARVSGTCAGTQAIQAVAPDGTVTCGGSPRAWALVYPDGTVGSSSPGVTWTVTHLGTGHYCIATTPNLLGNYDPLVATLHGYLPGLVNVNTEYGDGCNPVSNGHAVYTWDASGVAADRYFVLSLM
jgi:hypothetical protein